LQRTGVTGVLFFQSPIVLSPPWAEPPTPSVDLILRLSRHGRFLISGTSPFEPFDPPFWGLFLISLLSFFFIDFHPRKYPDPSAYKSSPASRPAPFHVLSYRRFVPMSPTHFFRQLRRTRLRTRQELRHPTCLPTFCGKFPPQHKGPDLPSHFHLWHSPDTSGPFLHGEFVVPHRCVVFWWSDLHLLPACIPSPMAESPKDF